MFTLSIKMLKEISHLTLIDIHFDIIDKYILVEAAKINSYCFRRFYVEKELLEN